MNRDQEPVRLLSGSTLAGYLNRLRENARITRPTQGQNVRVVSNTRGTSVVSLARRGATPSSGGMNFKGEWSATEEYSIDDVVLIRGGTEAGTFVCVRAVTGGGGITEKRPAQGLYWVSLSRAHPMGVWR